jgi:hypothetical protein
MSGSLTTMSSKKGSKGNMPPPEAYASNNTHKLGKSTGRAQSLNTVSQQITYILFYGVRKQ